MRITRSSKPSPRRVSAAFAPARLAPTITNVWSLLMRCPRRQGQELLACTGVIAHAAVQRRRHRLGAELLHATQRHAQVLSLQNHSDALGLQLARKPAGDLGGQALL